MSDLEVFQKAKTFADYSRLQKQDDLAMVDAYSRARSNASGANLPATIRVAREIQQALARGDNEYAQMLIDAGKIDPKGTIRDFGIGGDMGANFPQSNALPPSMTSALPSQKGNLAEQVTDAMKDLPPLPDKSSVGPMFNVPPPISDTPMQVSAASKKTTGGIQLRPGMDTVEGQLSAAKERAKLEQQLALEPEIASRKKSAELASTRQDARVGRSSKAKEMINAAIQGKALLKNAPAGLIGQASIGAAGLAGIDIADSETQAQLEILSANLVANVPRMEGPQSNFDVMLYQKAAGDIANPLLPRGSRQAAMDTVIGIQMKYADMQESPATSSEQGESNAIVQVNSPEEAMALPKGTPFMTPDGRMKVR